MSNASGPRKKSWYESKYLRKRAAFLLEDPNLIPTDVCFRIRTKNGKIKEVHGHKIFFGLASPVFYAMFYGSMKEQGNVEITDVSAEAFLCLQKYIYTDSYDGVSTANMIDVLAASKKCLMDKLTRFCYGFIQNHISADNSVSLWRQAEDVFDEKVAKQCASEIKRNTAEAVLSEDFLTVSQDQILEITSWQELTINEFDLFEAVKRWKIFQENTTGSVVSCSRNDGGIFQNIRFALLTQKQLTDKFIHDEVFSAQDLKEMFCYKNAEIEVANFSPRTREPVSSSFLLTIKYYVSTKFTMSVNMEWRMVGFVDMVIWADVAPKACQLLRRYVENDYHFRVGHTVGDFDDANCYVPRPAPLY